MKIFGLLGFHDFFYGNFFWGGFVGIVLFCIILFKVLRLLIKVTKVATGHQEWPKMSQGSIISRLYILVYLKEDFLVKIQFTEMEYFFQKLAHTSIGYTIRSTLETFFSPYARFSCVKVYPHKSKLIKKRNCNSLSLKCEVVSLK